MKLRISLKTAISCLSLSSLLGVAACAANSSSAPDLASQGDALVASQVIKQGALPFGTSNLAVSVPAATATKKYVGYAVTARAGDVIDVWARGASRGADARVWLTDASFNNITGAQNDNAAAGTLDAHVVYTAPTAGTYYVALRDVSLRAGSFTLSLAAVSAPECDPDEDEGCTPACDPDEDEDCGAGGSGGAGVPAGNNAGDPTAALLAQCTGTPRLPTTGPLAPRALTRFLYQRNCDAFNVCSPWVALPSDTSTTFDGNSWIQPNGSVLAISSAMSSNASSRASVRVCSDPTQSLQVRNIRGAAGTAAVVNGNSSCTTQDATAWARSLGQRCLMVVQPPFAETGNFGVQLRTAMKLEW